jgi:hypothetical protein
MPLIADPLLPFVAAALVGPAGRGYAALGHAAPSTTLGRIAHDSRQMRMVPGLTPRDMVWWSMSQLHRQAGPSVWD